MLLVPERLEHAVGEAKGQDVLHRLLAEIMVDAIDLAFIPKAENPAIEFAGRFQIGSKGLLDDDPFPTGKILEAGPFEIPRDQAEDGRRRGHIEEDVSAGPVLGIELGDQLAEPFEGRRIAELARRVIQPRAKLLPDGRIEFRPGVELLDLLAQPPAEFVGQPFVHRHPDDRKLRRQQTVALEIVKRRHQQPLGQVARGAEDDHQARAGRRARDASRRFGIAGAMCDFHDGEAPKKARRCAGRLSTTAHLAAALLRKCGRTPRWPKRVGSRFRHDTGSHYKSFGRRNRLPTPSAAKHILALAGSWIGLLE